ncbi:hypothetical protein ElyMa_001142100 [Elysia marginata]|uniref:Uncharacterized protein n=1 Tax=Elysia marginata TaxID=1093978 RepID=A0AAV4HY87_9GAST|nr:hypothetical protein ElyMa_001142100 [Elysia marginata]
MLSPLISHAGCSDILIANNEVNNINNKILYSNFNNHRNNGHRQRSINSGRFRRSSPNNNNDNNNKNYYHHYYNDGNSMYTTTTTTYNTNNHTRRRTDVWIAPGSRSRTGFKSATITSPCARFTDDSCGPFSAAKQSAPTNRNNVPNNIFSATATTTTNVGNLTKRPFQFRKISLHRANIHTNMQKMIEAMLYKTKRFAKEEIDDSYNSYPNINKPRLKNEDNNTKNNENSQNFNKTNSVKFHDNPTGNKVNNNSINNVNERNTNNNHVNLVDDVEEDGHIQEDKTRSSDDDGDISAARYLMYIDSPFSGDRDLVYVTLGDVIFAALWVMLLVLLVLGLQYLKDADDNAGANTLENRFLPPANRASLQRLRTPHTRRRRNL